MHEKFIKESHVSKGVEVVPAPISKKIRSLELCLSAHPDNLPDSEFADRISDLEELPKLIEVEGEKKKIEGILTGLKICKEMWAQGTISHENIRENEIHYKEELKSLINPSA